MKKIILGIALGELALVSLMALMGEIKAHKKYNKGWNDGAVFGYALSGLEHTIKEIVNDKD